MVSFDQQETYLLKCALHRDNNLEYLHLFDTTGDPFYCFQCLRNKEISLNDIILIKEIFEFTEENSTKTLSNFPPVSSNTIKQKLKDISNLSTQDELFCQVEGYFCDLQQQFEETISRVKSQVKKQITEIVVDFKKDLSKKQAEIASIKTIKDLIIERKDGMKEQVSEILKQIIADTEKNTKVLKSCFENRAINGCFSLHGPQNMIKNIIGLVDKLDFFSGKGQEIVKKQSTDINKAQFIEDSQSSSSQLIMQLIQNKTNYCSQELISQVQQLFNDFDFYFSQHSFGDNQYDQSKRDSFQKLNTEQLEDIRLLSQKIIDISNLNQINNDSDTINLECYPRTHYFMKTITGLFGQNNTNTKILLKQYPILELAKPQFLFQFSLLKQTEMLQNSSNSRFCSSFLLISRNDKNHIIMQSTKINNPKKSYSDFILDPSKRYLFRLHISPFETVISKFVRIGIIEDKTKDSIQKVDNLFYYSENEIFKQRNVLIRGEGLHLGNQKQEDRILEMRIFLNQRFLRVSNYPNYENVWDIKMESPLNLAEKYRFGIQFYEENTTVTINEILEVSEFDLRM